LAGRKKSGSGSAEARTYVSRFPKSQSDALAEVHPASGARIRIGPSFDADGYVEMDRTPF
jgi:hypothetical protein